jgi:transcriptional regulator GlxA family with amidase domain
MLRARDAMDRTFAEPLCIPRLARIAEVSEAHFIRTFCATFSETPHRYLQRRRIERAMFLLRTTDRSITDKTYETLLAKGVEFTQEPVEQAYGIDAGLRDPFGNHIRIVQLKLAS